MSALFRGGVRIQIFTLMEYEVSNYWKKYLGRKASRRRVLAGGGAAAIGTAALLAGCGDDGDDAPASSAATAAATSAATSAATAAAATGHLSLVLWNKGLKRGLLLFRGIVILD